jgi:hypothetical protein
MRHDDHAPELPASVQAARARQSRIRRERLARTWVRTLIRSQNEAEGNLIASRHSPGRGRSPVPAGRPRLN